MADVTADDILDAAAQIAAGGVSSATTDGQSVTAIDPLKQIEAADRIASRDALRGANVNGGPRSGWNGLRPARVIPPGGV